MPLSRLTPCCQPFLALTAEDHACVVRSAAYPFEMSSETRFEIPEILNQLDLWTGSTNSIHKINRVFGACSYRGEVMSLWRLMLESLLSPADSVLYSLVDSCHSVLVINIGK